MKIQEKAFLSGTRQSPRPQAATFTCRNISGMSYMYVVPKDCAWNLLDWSRSLVTYGVLINIPCNGPCLSPYAWNMICKKKRMAWGINRQEKKKNHMSCLEGLFFTNVISWNTFLVSWIAKIHLLTLGTWYSHLYRLTNSKKWYVTNHKSHAPSLTFELVEINEKAAE